MAENNGSPIATDQSPSVDLALLLGTIQAQMQASAARETQLTSMLQQALTASQSSPGSSPNCSSVTTATGKPVSAERPIILSSATLSDFMSWEEAWDDYSRCQHLSSQDQQTRMAAFRQSLDEDLRRFIREDVIKIPPSADVPGAIAALKIFIRRQRNPLLGRIDFYRSQQHHSELF